MDRSRNRKLNGIIEKCYSIYYENDKNIKNVKKDESSATIKDSEKQLTTGTEAEPNNDDGKLLLCESDSDISKVECTSPISSICSSTPNDRESSVETIINNTNTENNNNCKELVVFGYLATGEALKRKISDLDGYDGNVGKKIKYDSIKDSMFQVG